MKIVYLAAGAAGMYCGSCLHDNTLAGALRKLGEDCLLVPTYTPIRTDEIDYSEPYVFFSGINAALQQKLPWLGRTPFWLDQSLAAPWLLRKLSVFSGAVDPARLGPMTLSILQGPDGRQVKELNRLVRWLACSAQPDVVHLSNSMLCGWAGAIGSALQRPVVCSLSGEDLFLDQLAEPWRQRVREELRARAQSVTCFVALNHYYADYMADYLSVPRSRIRTIPHGLDLTGHGRRTAPAARPTGATLGYFARLCPEKGLSLLVEAWRRLASDPRQPSVDLHVAGYLGRRDRPLLEQLQSRIAGWGLGDRFKYFGSPDRAGKIAFLQSLDVFALPTIYPESKGLTVLEAWANGVPVVVPDHGTFREFIADTGGGLLCQPGDADDLACQVSRLLANPLEASDLGKRGQDAVRQRYHAQLMAERTRALYRELRAAPDAADDFAGATGENLTHA